MSSNAKEHIRDNLWNDLVLDVNRAGNRVCVGSNKQWLDETAAPPGGGEFIPAAGTRSTGSYQAADSKRVTREADSQCSKN